MKRFLQVGNILSVIFTIGANYAAVVNTALPSVSEVSARFDTLLTPASYAFSIWSLIFFLLALLAIYQARDIVHPREKNKLPQKMSGWFIVANVLSGIWTYVFVQSFILLSVFVLLGLVFSLVVLIKRLDIATYDAPLPQLAFVWWPISLYAGWAAIASVVNIASCLASVGVTFEPITASAVIVLFAAALSFFLWKRNLRELVLASTWGISAIAVGQSATAPVLWFAANAVSALLILQILLHAYRNRSTNPLTKLYRRFN